MSWTWLPAGASATIVFDDAELHIVAPDYSDGHGVFMDEAAVVHWAPVVETFLGDVFKSRTTAGAVK